MTILYDGREEILIIKLPAGGLYCVVTAAFARMFDTKLFLLGVHASLFPIGSATFGRRGSRLKEANISYIPCSRRVEEDWPSFVMEVGVLVSLAMLHSDVAFWITSSDGRTRIVIVLSINRRDRRTLVE
jgi:hypothetical protein